MRIAWIGFLDVNTFSGGGELAQRELLAVGRTRGHTIVESAFLRGRLQRLLRRTGRYRRLPVDWNADIFVLSNLRNSPQLGLRFPESLIEKILATKRVVLIEDAWVDTCELDMPCGGDRSACPASCNRTWSNRLYSRVQVIVFVSPMQQRMIRSVLDARLPPFQIVRRPFVDVSQFRPLGLKRDIDVLYVGAINEAKGYRNLIERFGADRMTFVGRNGLDEPVAGTYLGELPYHELPQIYNRARTFAHLPQWHEPMGRTVVEAALCGREVITNERVGATSFSTSEWTDPDLIAGHGERFWIEFEQAAQQLHGGRLDVGPSVDSEPAKT
jgi:glycosyltransferase involved in cell wall biosynthesis